MTSVGHILRASFRRLLITSAFAAALVWLATYLLIRIDAPVAIVVVLPVLVGVAALMQTVRPGAGIAFGSGGVVIARAAAAASPSAGVFASGTAFVERRTSAGSPERPFALAAIGLDVDEVKDPELAEWHSRRLAERLGEVQDVSAVDVVSPVELLVVVELPEDHDLALPDVEAMLEDRWTPVAADHGIPMWVGVAVSAGQSPVGLLAEAVARRSRARDAGTPFGARRLLDAEPEAPEPGSVRRRAG